jgi:hypothetical protein
MDESAKQVFQASQQIISRLQLLLVVFEEEVVANIYVRTQVIHKLFENNAELDVNKLQLFHFQFTESIIGLLRKVKKNNEKAYQSLLDEMEVNNDLMRKLSQAMKEKDNFDYEKEVQAARVNKTLAGLYENFSDYLKTNPVPKDIADFGKRFAPAYFYPLPQVAINQLLDFEPEEVYRNAYGIVEKKLMGLQCKKQFNNRFYCGIRCNTQLLEVYKVQDEESFFLFYPDRSLFLVCPTTFMDELPVTNTVSAKGKLMEELAEKTLLLKEKSKSIKKQLPPEVKTLLEDYYTKIEGIDFLDLIDDYDIQANILKTMLNTDSM